MNAILDTNFIISCIRKKIDFMSQLEEQGFKVMVPREVMQELKDIRLRSSASHEDRMAIDLALGIFSQHGIKRISLGEGRVDDWLIHMGKQGYYVATLDQGIKRAVPHSIVIFDAQKRVGVE